MDIKNLIIVVSFLLISYSYGQSKGSIEVEVTYKKALINNKGKSKTPIKFVNDLSYKLIANDSVALFKRNESMKTDTEFDNSYRLATRGGNGIYYKNRRKKIKLRQVETAGELFLITYPYNEWNIELTRETKKIDQYTCYKAILTKDEYSSIQKKKVKIKAIVWYTPEIPLPFGVAGFDGLPGLVLEVTKGGTYIVVDNIKFKTNNSKTKILPPKGGIEVTVKGYNEKLLELFKKIRKRKN
ncbi:GLPGLI family protein [Kordia algicida OT-1]|uniref:GLPGLI family protein n=1 Tax=Kordia algicida OT-1 TaxID=391587 RepID=A9E9V6_9FLAO|nr:GLPGLI family protein [Kordia algicida]EDP94709.1 hypothetical protein KAOT1_00495 [Kordia algicida OT-1]